MHKPIAVLDFGSQYTQIIARRIRECQVYSTIYPYSVNASLLKKDRVAGIILSGGPASTLSPNSPQPDPSIFSLNIPVLGICYGLQLMANLLGGKVSHSDQREFGHGKLKILKKGKLLSKLPRSLQVWNSHGDKVIQLPKGFEGIASTENSSFAVIANQTKRFYGMQFHPEVAHSEKGTEILQNFLYSICGCQKTWNMTDYIEKKVEEIRKVVGNQKVILGLSGGVDSSVAAALIHRAIGNQLTCIFVDNGLLRLNEREEVQQMFEEFFSMNLITAKSGSLFLKKLKGISNPERKRKIIGKTFIEVFEGQLKKVKGASFLAQGTLYPDIIESVSIEGNPASVIKSHHNVGGLPKRMKLKLLEPLKQLFKDEVRKLGESLGLPSKMIHRHPFPGPGLAVRVMGEIRKKDLDVLKKADAIFIEELLRSGYYEKVWQAFAVFLPVKTVGVMGDERTYENVIALRAVESQDAMTADWARLPHEVLRIVSSRIINEVQGINRVTYDITSKPPGTIEWE